MTSHLQSSRRHRSLSWFVSRAVQTFLWGRRSPLINPIVNKASQRTIRLSGAALWALFAHNHPPSAPCECHSPPFIAKWREEINSAALLHFFISIDISFVWVEVFGREQCQKSRSFQVSIMNDRQGQLSRRHRQETGVLKTSGLPHEDAFQRNVWR